MSFLRWQSKFGSILETATILTPASMARRRRLRSRYVVSGIVLTPTAVAWRRRLRARSVVSGTVLAQQRGATSA